MKTISTIIAAAALLGPCIASQAYEATFWGEDQGNGDGNPLITSWPNASGASSDFQSHLTGTGTETFEEFANGQTGPYAINFPGAGTATLSGGDASIVQDPGSESVGRFNTTPGGSKFLEIDQNFTISFSAPVAAFGFFATDVGDFGGTLTLTFTDGTTKTVTVPAISSPLGGSVEFFGYIDTDDPFTKVTFGDTETTLTLTL